MLIALDNNGNRIQASKGALGECQVCGNRVRAYCGEINIHHWRHIDLSKCDFWKENETEWHRQWKAYFPVEWQEVVIKKDEKIHRADIKTNKGLVVEFQNSSISSGEIKQREKFYGNMIWLINAKGFKDNFRLWSLVKSQLKYLKENYSIYYQALDNESDSYEVENQKKIISEIQGDSSSNSYNIDRIKNTIQEIEDLKKSLKTTTREFIKGYFGYFNPMKDFKSDLKDHYTNSKKELKELKKELNNKIKLLHKIDSFKKCKINSLEKFHVVDYKYINAKHYKICKLVEKDSLNSLFPEIINFNSESDFLRTARSKNHILVIDFTSIRHKLEKEQQKLILDIQRKKEVKKNYKRKLKVEIKGFLKKLLKKERKILKGMNELDLDLQNKLYHEQEILNRIKDQENQENIENYTKTLEEEKQKRFQIMSKFKGLYGYKWKHRRKTWDFSNRSLYLDFGNEVFYIQNDSTLKKYSHEEFINYIKNLM